MMGHLAFLFHKPTDLMNAFSSREGAFSLTEIGFIL